MLKRHLLSALESPVVDGLLKMLEPLEGGSQHLLRILTYHRVDDPDARPHLSPALLSATPAMFAQQMEFISEHYTPVGIEEVLAALRGQQALPRRAILVTFDDAYRDFKEQAWPILQRYAIPAVLFVPTAYPDHPQRRLWWDVVYDVIQRTEQQQVELDGHALPLDTPAARKTAFKAARNFIKSLPHETAMQAVDALCDRLAVIPNQDNYIMTWDEIRELAAAGVVMGAHTQTHPLLNRVSLDEAAQEARASYDDLSAKLGDVLPIFAYPSGGANEAVAQRLAQEGFELAVTTERGINRLGAEHPLLLKRINIGGNTGLNTMRVQLLRSVGQVQSLISP